MRHKTKAEGKVKASSSAGKRSSTRARRCPKAPSPATRRGSDTALIVRAASSQHLKKLRVDETLCKPLNPLNLEEIQAKRDREMSR